MKKILLIIGLSLTTLCMQSQQYNGGLFKRGQETQESQIKPLMYENNNEQKTPIGSGAALLIGFGAAYAMYKKNKK